MNAEQLARVLDHHERKALRHLAANRGTLAGDRARELRIMRVTVFVLVNQQLARVDGATGDLELTPEGLEVVEAMNAQAAKRPR